MWTIELFPVHAANQRLGERSRPMPEMYAATPIEIPREFLAEFKEVRVLFPPYPGLLIINARMLGQIRELMAQPEIAERFEIMLVPKV
jgi:hypothetical protein